MRARQLQLATRRVPSLRRYVAAPIHQPAVHSAEETGWSSYVTDGGLTYCKYWRPVLAFFGSTLPHRPACQAVAGRPYVHDTFWRCVPLTHYVRIARRVLHEALVGWGARPSVFCRLCV